MSDLTLTIGGDDKDAQKAWDRQQRQIAKLKESINDLKNANRRAGDEAKKTHDDQANALTAHVKGLVSIGAAVGVVTAAHREWRAEVTKLAAESSKFHSDLIKSMNRAGDLANAGEIKAAIRSAGGTQEEGSAAYNAISGSSPGADLGRRLGLMKSVVRMAPISKDVGATGELAGELAEMMPGTKPEDIADLVAKLTSQSGADAGRLSSAGFLRGAKMLSDASGVDLNTSLATGAHALSQNMDPRLLEKMAAAIQSRADNVKKGGGLSADQKLKNKFGAMSAGDAFKAIVSDQAMQRAVLGDTGGAKGAQLSQAEIAKLAEEQRAAMAGDEVGDRLAAARKFDPGTFAQRAEAIGLQQANMGREDSDREIELGSQFLERKMAEKGLSGLHKFRGRMYHFASELFANTVGVPAGQQGAWALEATGQSAGLTPEDIREFVQASRDLREAAAASTQRKAIVKGGEQ